MESKPTSYAQGGVLSHMQTYACTDTRTRTHARTHTHAQPEMCLPLAGDSLISFNFNKNSCEVTDLLMAPMEEIYS